MSDSQPNPESDGTLSKTPKRHGPAPEGFSLSALFVLVTLCAVLAAAFGTAIHSIPAADRNLSGSAVLIVSIVLGQLIGSVLGAVMGFSRRRRKMGCLLGLLLGAILGGAIGGMASLDVPLPLLVGGAAAVLVLGILTGLSARRAPPSDAP